MSQIANLVFDEPAYRVARASRGTVLIPTSLSRVRGGMWLYGAIRPSMVTLQILNGWLAGRSIKLVPGRRASWNPPVPTDQLHALLTNIENIDRNTVGNAIVLLPRDPRRRRFSLLLLDPGGTPIAFAKFTRNPPNPMAIAALYRFSDAPSSSYWVPRLLAEGTLDSYSYTVTSPMPNRAHFPAHLTTESRLSVVSDIQKRLADLVQEPLVATHGDFGAWNVRSFRDGSLAIVDWEETGPGVPAADEMWHVLSRIRKPHENGDLGRLVGAALSHHDQGTIRSAAEYWIQKLSRPEPTEVDPSVEMSPRLQQASQGIRELLRELSEQTT